MHTAWRNPLPSVPYPQCNLVTTRCSIQATRIFAFIFSLQQLNFTTHKNLGRRSQSLVRIFIASTLIMNIKRFVEELSKFTQLAHLERLNKMRKALKHSLVEVCETRI